MNIKEIGKEVLLIESAAVRSLANHLDEQFEKAVKAIYQNEGTLIVTGMGKSGHIGAKLAATFASTGTPSHFVHPAEAFHGDLGMIDSKDVVLAISYSGETNEVLQIIPFFKDNGNIVISVTGFPHSTLAKNSTFHLFAGVTKEACPLDLVPTSSTTVALAMGDALAISLMKIRGFKEDNFARLHPGGSLGKKLLIKVDSVMRQENLPIIAPDSTATEIISTMTSGKLGLVVIKNENKVLGIITDGDLRRAMNDFSERLFKIKANDIMSTVPKYISSDAKLIEAEKMMNQFKINSLLVIDENKLVGILQIYDLYRAL